MGMKNAKVSQSQPPGLAFLFLCLIDGIRKIFLQKEFQPVFPDIFFQVGKGDNIPFSYTKVGKVTPLHLAVYGHQAHTCYFCHILGAESFLHDLHSYPYYHCRLFFHYYLCSLGFLLNLFLNQVFFQRGKVRGQNDSYKNPPCSLRSHGGIF